MGQEGDRAGEKAKSTSAGFGEVFLVRKEKWSLKRKL